MYPESVRETGPKAGAEWVKAAAGRVLQLWEGMQNAGEEWKRMSAKTRREMTLLAVTLVVAASMVLASCSPSEAYVTQPEPTDTGSVSTQTLPASEIPPTLSPLPPTEPVFTPSPEVILPVAICNSGVAELNLQGDRTDILGNPMGSWQQTEKDNIVDAAGNPIFPDVLRIAKNGAAAGLDPVEVAIGGADVGGYSVVFKDQNGNYVWNQVQDASGNWVAASRPDANGMITPGRWTEVPAPGQGRIEPWMQRVDGGSCAYLVSAREDGTVVGRYEPLSNTWVMEEEQQLIPSATETQIQVITLSMDVKNPTFLTWEQFLSNRFQVENLQPFDEKAYLSGFRREDAGKYWIPVLTDSYSDPESRPMRWAGFAIVEKDGHDFFVAREEVKNRDGTIGELFFAVGYDKPDPNLLGYVLHWRGRDLAYATPVVPVEQGYCDYVPVDVICSEYPSDLEQLVKNFMDTGVVPADLSRVLLIANNNPWEH